MNKVKTVLIIILLISLYSISTLAADNSVNLGIKDIIDIALEQNVDLQIAELNLEDARLSYKKSQLNNLLTSSKLMELQSELAKVQAEEAYKNTRDAVILDVVGQYIDIVSTNQKLITAQKEVDLEARKVEEVKAQVEVGYKGSLELFEQETTYQAAVNSLEKTKDELAQKIRELKQTLAVNNDINIDFIKLSKPEIWSVSEEEVLKTAVGNNAMLDIRKQQVTLAENNLQKAKVSGTPEIDLKKSEISLEKAKLELTKERQSLENDIQNKHFQYKQAVKNMNMAEKTVTQAEEHYKIIKEQEAAGLVSKNDLLSSELSLYKAKDNYTASIINYYLNKLQLQKAMGIELEVNINEGANK